MNAPDALDENIYDWIEEYGAFEAYAYLDGDRDFREEQRKKFIANEVRNPHLDYPKLSVEKLREIELQLLALRDLVHKDEIVYAVDHPELDEGQLTEHQSLIKHAYIQKINEKIAEIRLLGLTARLKSEDEDHRYETMMKFRKLSEFIYGRPKKEIFNYTLSSIRTNAQEHIMDSDTTVALAAKELIESLPELGESPNFQIPSQEEFITAQSASRQQLGDLVEIGLEDAEYSAETIKNIFEQALSNLQADDWEVIIGNNIARTGIHVSQEDRRVVIPETRTLSVERLRALIYHEIGTHVARRVNGERSSLKLLGLGLSRYKDDEGI